jgi:hypothetical protein
MEVIPEFLFLMLMTNASSSQRMKIELSAKTGTSNPAASGKRPTSNVEFKKGKPSTFEPLNL